MTEKPSILDPYKATIDTWLEEDKRCWYKQRHTAQRIHDRLVIEVPGYDRNNLFGPIPAYEEIVAYGTCPDAPDSAQRFRFCNSLGKKEMLMIATKEYITNLRQTSRMSIDASLEAYILAEYGENPFPDTWSEQDLYEQIRKLVGACQTGKLDISIANPYQHLLKKMIQ